MVIQKMVLGRETDWYFTDGTTNFPYNGPYTPPETPEGEVVFIVGRLDSTAPGVSGPRVLVGTVTFDRNPATIPTIGLALGRDDGPEG